MALELKVVEYSSDIGVVTVLSSCLDASNAKEFKKNIEPLLDQYKEIVLNLRGIEFIASLGIGAFLSSLRDLNARGGNRGGNLRLCGVTKPVSALFELVGMHMVFDIYDNVDEAVAYIGRPRDSQY